MSGNSTNNPLEEAYALLGASSSNELAREFIKEDQRLLRIHTWDYEDEKLVLNKIKEIVECVVEDGLATDDESIEELKDILWFWYHHATGLAIWDHKDKVRALEFSDKALKYQTADNPNQITRLLYLLVRDEEAEATVWLRAIIDDPDKTAARQIMKEYQTGNFFKKE